MHAALQKKSAEKRGNWSIRLGELSATANSRRYSQDKPPFVGRHTSWARSPRVVGEWGKTERFSMRACAAKRAAANHFPPLKLDGGTGCIIFGYRSNVAMPHARFHRECNLFLHLQYPRVRLRVSKGGLSEVRAGAHRRERKRSDLRGGPTMPELTYVHPK
jgi:hypothetical protein